LWRAQFTIALSEVSATFCLSSAGTTIGDSFASGARSIARAIVVVLSRRPIRTGLERFANGSLAPVERALTPGVGEADQQDRDEDEHLGQRDPAGESRVSHGPREDEDRLHVE